MQTDAVLGGVTGKGGAWTWGCVHCGQSSPILESREEARAGYRLHRRDVCGLSVVGEATSTTNQPHRSTAEAEAPAPAPVETEKAHTPAETDERAEAERDLAEEQAQDALADQAAFDEEEARLEEQACEAAETRREVENREKLWAGLENVQSRRRVYITIALTEPTLAPTACRLLIFLALRYTDPDLGKCWPYRSTIAKRLGWKLSTVDKWLIELGQSGWIKRHTFQRTNGSPSSSGVQFRVPPGIVGAAGWAGPIRFDRDGVVEANPKRRHDHADA